MKRDYKGLVSLIFAVGLVLTVLIGVAGLIWRGDKISVQGSVVIGMVIGAVTIIGAGYLGIYLTYIHIRMVRPLWPGEISKGEEDTLEHPKK